MKQYIKHLLSMGWSSTAKDTYWVFGGDATFTVSTLLTTIMVARALTVEHFGVFVVLQTILIILLDIADIGVGSSLSHFIPHYFAKKNSDRVWSIVKVSILFETAMAILIALLFIIGSRFASSILFKSSKYASLVVLMGIATGMALISTLFSYTLTALERFPQRAIINSLPALFRLITVGILFWSNTLTLLSVVGITVLSFFPSLIAGLFFIGKDWVGAIASFRTFRILFSFSKFIGISKGITSLASRLDVIMLSSLAGSVETGIYGAASRMTLVYPMLVGSFSAVIAPKLTKRVEYQSLIQFLKRISLVTILLAGSAIVLSMVADILVPLVFGEKYNSSIAVFQLLMIPNIIFIATIPTVNLIIYRFRKPHVISIASFIQLIVIVITNLIFIPKWGRFGPIPGLSLAFGQMLLITSVVSANKLNSLKHEK